MNSTKHFLVVCISLDAVEITKNTKVGRQQSAWLLYIASVANGHGPVLKLLVLCNGIHAMFFCCNERHKLNKEKCRERNHFISLQLYFRLEIWFHFSYASFDRIFFLFGFCCRYSIVHVILSKNESVTDFFMESAIDGAHKGVFRSDIPVNWHRKHKQHHTNYNGDHLQSKDDFSKRKLFSSHFVGSNVTRSTVAQNMKKVRVDESGIEIPNGHGERMTALDYSTSLPRRSKRLKMSPHVADHCTQEFWSETINPSGRTVFTRRWSYNKADLKNKTVTFRLVFDFGCVHTHFVGISSFTSSTFSLDFYLDENSV